MSNDEKNKDDRKLEKHAELDKKEEKTPKELEDIIIDTSTSSVKEDSTEILEKLRNGNNK
jgi:hypothetical protein